MVEGIVIWGVLWFLSIIVVPLLLIPAAAIITAKLSNNDELYYMGSFFGWLLSTFWCIFAIIQVALHIVHLVQATT